MFLTNIQKIGSIIFNMFIIEKLKYISDFYDKGVTFKFS